MIYQSQFNLLSFGKRWDTGGEGNPTGHCFHSNELQIIHDCETENVHHRQNFW